MNQDKFQQLQDYYTIPNPNGPPKSIFSYITNNMNYVNNSKNNYQDRFCLDAPINNVYNGIPVANIDVDTKLRNLDKIRTYSKCPSFSKKG